MSPDLARIAARAELPISVKWIDGQYWIVSLATGQVTGVKSCNTAKAVYLAMVRLMGGK